MTEPQHHTITARPIRFAMIETGKLRFQLVRRSMYNDRISSGDKLIIMEEALRGAGPTGRYLECTITGIISGFEMPGLHEDIWALSLNLEGSYEPTEPLRIHPNQLEA